MAPSRPQHNRVRQRDECCLLRGSPSGRRRGRFSRRCSRFCRSRRFGFFRRFAVATGDSPQKRHGQRTDRDGQYDLLPHCDTPLSSCAQAGSPVLTANCSPGSAWKSKLWLLTSRGGTAPPCLSINNPCLPPVRTVTCHRPRWRPFIRVWRTCPENPSGQNPRDKRPCGIPQAFECIMAQLFPYELRTKRQIFRSRGPLAHITGSGTAPRDNPRRHTQPTRRLS